MNAWLYEKMGSYGMAHRNVDSCCIDDLSVWSLVVLPARR